MIYYQDGELVIRGMEQPDARIFTDEEIAQGWHADISKYLTRLKDRDEGKCIPLTAVYKGHPAGYVNVYTPGLYGPFSGMGLPEIVDFGVLEKYRRKGIGTRLMDTAEQIAGQYADTVWLGVGLHDGYGSAQRMYVKRGYVPDGSGVWYQEKPCTPYDTIYTNDDDLILYLSKKLFRTDEYDTLIRRFTERSAEILKDRLTGIYLHGSAAMGCFHPKKSDLDFLTVVSGQLTDAEKREYMDMVLALDAEGPAKGIEMSVVTREACNPFVYPTPFILHYSRMHTDRYRKDPEEYIRKMNGTDRDLAAHFTVIRSRGRCLYGSPAAEVFGEVPETDYLDSIWNDVSGAEEEITDNPMYLILNLARVLAFRREKVILSKQEGGKWGLRNLPEEYRPLIRTALGEYEGAAAQYDPETAKRYAAYMLEQIKKPSGPEREPESR